MIKHGKTSPKDFKCYLIKDQTTKYIKKRSLHLKYNFFHTIKLSNMTQNFTFIDFI